MNPINHVVVGGVFYSLERALEMFPTCDVIEFQKRKAIGASDESALLEPNHKFKDLIKDCFGLSVALDCYGGNRKRLLDMGGIYEFLRNLPAAIDMTRIDGPNVIEYSGTEPLDWGVTGSVTLAESLISLHTFPERDGFITLDAYSCKCYSPYKLMQLTREFFEWKRCEIYIQPRGLRFSRDQKSLKAAASPGLRRYTP